MAAPHNPALTITLKLNRSKIVINVNSSFRAGAVEAHIRPEAVSLTTESIGSRADVGYEPRRTAPCPNGDVRCRLRIGAAREFQLLNRLQPRQMRRATHRHTESAIQAEYVGFQRLRSVAVALLAAMRISGCETADDGRRAPV
jgi:hypothetical protein